VTVFSDFASKPVATVSLGLASKLVATVSQFGPQNRQLQFDDLSLKITATDFWFGPQNQAGFSLSVASQNRWREDDAGHVLRSNDLLRLEASCARVTQSGLKASGDTTTCVARGIIVEVTSSGS
jgi:hypothetical protein